jgi:hypothetical protein
MAGSANRGSLGTEANSPQIDESTTNRNRTPPPGLLRPHYRQSLGPGVIPLGTLASPVAVTATRQQDHSPPLTLDEMWSLVQSKRGFESSPGGKDDKLRQRPSTIRFDPNNKGPAIGPGYQTFGAIQIVDKDGNRLAIGADYFQGGKVRGISGDDHAEARILSALEKELPDKVPAGRLEAVVDQDVCDECRVKLENFARRKGLSTIEAHVPERPNLQHPGRMASPKTTSRSSLAELRGPGGQLIKITFRKSLSLKLPVPKNLIQLRAIGTYAGGSLAMAAFGIFMSWARAKLDQSLIERQIRNLGPRIEEELHKKLDKVLDLQRVGKRAYANITVEIWTITTLEPEPGGPPIRFTTLPAVALKSVDVGDRNTNSEGQVRTDRGFGGTTTTVPYTFSFEIGL